MISAAIDHLQPGMECWSFEDLCEALKQSYERLCDSAWCTDAPESETQLLEKIAESLQAYKDFREKPKT
jgi:hypothetical protein